MSELDSEAMSLFASASLTLIMSGSSYILIIYICLASPQSCVFLKYFVVLSCMYSASGDITVSSSGFLNRSNLKYSEISFFTCYSILFCNGSS
jgi:hypothetical protein